MKGRLGVSRHSAWELACKIWAGLCIVFGVAALIMLFGFLIYEAFDLPRFDWEGYRPLAVRLIAAWAIPLFAAWIAMVVLDDDPGW